MAARPQSRQTAVRVALQMLVAGLAADAELLAQVGHAKASALGEDDESVNFFHGSYVWSGHAPYVSPISPDRTTSLAWHNTAREDSRARVSSDELATQGWRESCRLDRQRRCSPQRTKPDPRSALPCNGGIRAARQASCLAPSLATPLATTFRSLLPTQFTREENPPKKMSFILPLTGNITQHQVVVRTSGTDTFGGARNWPSPASLISQNLSWEGWDQVVGCNYAVAVPSWTRCAVVSAPLERTNRRSPGPRKPPGEPHWHMPSSLADSTTSNPPMIANSSRL